MTRVYSNRSGDQCDQYCTLKIMSNNELYQKYHSLPSILVFFAYHYTLLQNGKHKATSNLIGHYFVNYPVNFSDWLTNRPFCHSRISVFYEQKQYINNYFRNDGVFMAV